MQIDASTLSSRSATEPKPFEPAGAVKDVYEAPSQCGFAFALSFRETTALRETSSWTASRFKSVSGHGTRYDILANKLMTAFN